MLAYRTSPAHSGEANVTLLTVISSMVDTAARKQKLLGCTLSIYAQAVCFGLFFSHRWLCSDAMQGDQEKDNLEVDLGEHRGQVVVVVVVEDW
jgi:hypothetical protein